MLSINFNIVMFNYISCQCNKNYLFTYSSKYWTRILFIAYIKVFRVFKAVVDTELFCSDVVSNTIDLSLNCKVNFLLRQVKYLVF